MAAITDIAKRHFSPRTRKALAQKGIDIVGITAIPAFEGDRYFTGTAYCLIWNEDVHFVRTFHQVLTMARSSWDPAEYFLTH